MRAVVDFIVAPPQHHRRHDVPHVERRAAAPVRAPARRRDARRGPVGLPGARARRAPSSPATRRSRSTTSSAITRRTVIGGTFDWLYEHLGMFMLGRRDLVADARGRHRRTTSTSTGSATIRSSDDLKLYPLERRQARRPRAHARGGRSTIRSSGSVEIGGWNRFHAFSNPPPAFLERELARFPAWLLWQALRLAEARARRTRAPSARRRDDTLAGHGSSCRTRAGCRATCRSARSSARSCAASSPRSRCRPARRSCTASARDELGQLEGTAYKHTGVSFWPDYHITDDRMKVEWVVRGKAGSTVGLVARHEKAGVVRASVLLS